MFILILMLRQCITFLRTHGFNSILPLDHHIYLHKMVGVTIGVMSVVHTVAHLLNFGKIYWSIYHNMLAIYFYVCTCVCICVFVYTYVGIKREWYVAFTSLVILMSGLVVINDQVLNSSHYTMFEWLLTSRPGLFGLVSGVANPTGVALIIILFIMILCSMPFVRRGGSFEVFYIMLNHVLIYQC